MDERLGPSFQGIVELSTRPILVAALYENNYLRHRFLRRINVIWNICCLPDDRVASTLFECYWKQNVLPYLASFRQAHNEYPDYLLTNEMYATLRNVRRNALVRLGCSNPAYIRPREHDVMREFGEVIEM